MNKNISICIPRVDKYFNQNRILSILNRYKLGIIKEIKIIKNKKKNNNIIYIYFSSWYDNEYVNNIKKKIMEGKSVKIMYDEPWFWILVLNTN